MAFEPKEAEIWQKQLKKDKEAQIYEESYKVNEDEEEFEYLNE